MRALDVPMTIVAMREASDEINRMRIEFRQRFGADTIEVRQSMDTALQIRRRLAENRIVAMLMDRHVDRDRVRSPSSRPPRLLLRTPPLLAYMTGARCCRAQWSGCRRSRFRVAPGRRPRVARRRPRHGGAAGRAGVRRSARGVHPRDPHAWYQFCPCWPSQDARRRTGRPGRRPAGYWPEPGAPPHRRDRHVEAVANSSPATRRPCGRTPAASRPRTSAVSRCRAAPGGSASRRRRRLAAPAGSRRVAWPRRGGRSSGPCDRAIDQVQHVEHGGRSRPPAAAPRARRRSGRAAASPSA